MNRLAICVHVLAAVVPCLCAAQTPPSFALGSSGIVLAIPYIEYGAGASKLAFALSLKSSDLSSFTLDGSSVRSVATLTATVDSPAIAPLNAGYKFVLPRISYAAGGTTRYFAATLNTSDLNSYILDTTTAREITAAGTLAVPTTVAVTNVSQRTIGSSTIYSSSKLSVSWKAPSGYAVDHYELTATESIFGTTATTTATSAESSKTISGLKAATPYSVTVTACRDASCSQSGVSSAASGTTTEEYWQLQGSGNAVSGLTKIVSNSSARISATRFGSDAGGATASRIQLYYGTSPSVTTPSTFATAVTSEATDANSSASYLSFTSLAGTTGLSTPTTASTLVKTVLTGQGVPLSAAMGGKVRLFFESTGSDGKTRIMYLDSQDAYVGRDFNSGTATICSTTADYSTGGGCTPTVAIGVEGDSNNGNSKINNARQFKLGFPTLNDWRWDGAVGTFMVFTIDQIKGCTTSNFNHGYAVWDGSKFTVQYDATGCPKMFKSAQAAFPMHLGEARYKMYFGDPSITTGKITSTAPFLGPKKLIYADGRSSGASGTVDFEDWESASSGRDVIFVWPNGEKLSAAAEGYIDDFHFLAPTGSLDLQVMYLAITEGIDSDIGASAILLNP